MFTATVLARLAHLALVYLRAARPPCPSEEQPPCASSTNRMFRFVRGRHQNPLHEWPLRRAHRLRGAVARARCCLFFYPGLRIWGIDFKGGVVLQVRKPYSPPISRRIAQQPLAPPGLTCPMPPCKVSAAAATAMLDQPGIPGQRPADRLKPSHYGSPKRRFEQRGTGQQNSCSSTSAIGASVSKPSLFRPGPAGSFGFSASS